MSLGNSTYNPLTMSYIQFKTSQLTQMEFSSSREILRTNRAGAYISTTLNGCNTRKYHGLLVAPIAQFNGEKHVLLSQLDETIIQKGNKFHLGVRRFIDDHVEPRGNKYLYALDYERIPKYTYRVGGIILSKERLLADKKNQLLVRYTLEEAREPVHLEIRPFAAFRNIHALSKNNPYALTGFNEIAQGISIRMYEGYPDLCMQFSKQVEFTGKPDWYYNIEYTKEKNRGYECHEDLFTPGSFRVFMTPGESIVFSASLEEELPKTFKGLFARELSKRIPHEDFESTLKCAASQFIWFRDQGVDLIAGFPWYSSISRETFIALPGLRKVFTDRKLGMEILQTYIPHMVKGMFPRSIAEPYPVFDAADTSLWYIWSIQQMKKQGMKGKELWEKFWETIRTILESYRTGNAIVVTLENGLLFSADQGQAHTWMNSYADGKPVVPRYGMPVELNALWYNAVSFALDLARSYGDQDFINEWKTMPEKIGESFIESYWSDERGYLADVYNGFYTDWSVRPNMVIAAAMDNTPLSREQQFKISEIATHTLLTPKGLRTLSPDDPNYRGAVSGTPAQRESAAHNGAVHPWLLQLYAELILKIHHKSGISPIKKLIQSFEEEMTTNCLGTVSEMYNGNPPYQGKGSISQAWNVASLLSCIQLVAQAEKSTT